MKRTLQKLSILLLMMVIGMGSSWAQSDYSKVYDSNVTLSTEGGTKVTASTVKINETGYTALKAGTGSVAGVVVLNVPANTKYLHLHIAAWNNEKVSVSITPADILEATTLTLTANSDISGISNIYTFNSDATSEDYYKVVTFTGPLAEATTLTLSVTSGKRFVIWGVNAEEESDNPKQSVTISVTNPQSADAAQFDDKIEMNVGETVNFQAYASSQAQVSFSGDNDAVATVTPTDAGGAITAVGAGTMKVTFTTEEDDYFWAGKKEITVTVINPDQINSISDITAAGVYTVQGTIVAKSQRGFVVGDGTGYVYYYNQSYEQANYNVGDIVKIAGSVVVYGNVYEFNNTATITPARESNYKEEEPVVMTGSALDARVASQVAELSTFVQYQGTLSVNGTYYNITGIDGASTAQGSISYPLDTDFTSLDGKEVIVKGYYVGVSSSKYYNTMIVSIEAVEADDRIETYLTFDGVDYEDDEPVVYNELGEDFNAPTATLWDIEDNEIAGVVLNYESSDPDVAEVTPNGIKINGEGTAVITVSYDGSDVYQPCQLTYTIIVTANGGDEKQYPTYDIVDANQQPLSADQAPTIYVGEPFEFYVLTKAQGLSVTMEQNPNAEFSFDPETSKCTVTATDEGSITISISTEEDDVFYASDMELRIEAIYSQVEPQPTYNTVTWTLQNDQSTVSDDYAEWTHKDVKLTYEKNQSNTPVSQGVNADNGHTRFYANTTVSIVPSDGVEIAYVTFTTLGGKNVSADQTAENASIEIDGTAVKLTPKDGTKAMVLVMANQVRATDMTVYYTGEGTAPVELQDAIINVDGITDGQVVQAGETLSFTINTRSSGLNVTIDNEQAAQLDPGTTIYDYTLNTTNAGTVVVTITTDADNTYKAGTKTITITVVDATEPQFEIQDGVFDFTAGVDYGSGIKTTSDNGHYEESASTWTAGKITLVADGKYRWWTNANGSTLRFYAGSSMTFTAPAGYAITSISSNVTLSDFTAADGEVSGKEWTGEANAVTLTKEAGSAVNISNITVICQKADTYTRDVANGDYGTLCLPYKAYVSGATVYEIAGVVKDGDKLTDLALEEHTGALEAGVPYVFHATSAQVVATLVGEAVAEAAQAPGLVGNLSADNIMTPDGCYVLVDGVLRLVQGGTAYIQTNRAYFNLANVAEFSNDEPTAGVKYISISFDEDATGITELTEKTEATEGAIYNLQGQRVNSLQRGINIVGGKKVLVK
ncbi:MAG: OB-fold nucleic acid binding domain-containing protein [Bacteroidaceae bacterium]|nr:OB-fold nucleic acid binding domain-containing protein [Bacteroidaceae bacterium]